MWVGAGGGFFGKKKKNSSSHARTRNVQLPESVFPENAILMTNFLAETCAVSLSCNLWLWCDVSRNDAIRNAPKSRNKQQPSEKPIGGASTTRSLLRAGLQSYQQLGAHWEWLSGRHPYNRWQLPLCPGVILLIKPSTEKQLFNSQSKRQGCPAMPRGSLGSNPSPRNECGPLTGGSVLGKLHRAANPAYRG